MNITQNDVETVAKKLGVSHVKALSLLSSTSSSPSAASIVDDSHGSAGPSLADAARQLSDRLGIPLADAQAQVYAAAITATEAPARPDGKVKTADGKLVDPRGAGGPAPGMTDDTDDGGLTVRTLAAAIQKQFGCSVEEAQRMAVAAFAKHAA